MKIYHFRPKKEKKGLLYQVFFAVAAVMTVLLISFGSYVVTQSIINIDSSMEAPPTKEKVKPAERQRKVDLERQNRKSQKFVKRITMSNTNTQNVPDINISLPAGIGGGVAIATVSPIDIKSDFKITPSNVGLFGNEAKSEKVMICLDTGDYLMTDEKGGLDTYKVIKSEISKLINSLKPTTLFNLMAFENMIGTSMNMFQQGLTPANSFAKRMAIDWLAPFNVDYKSIGSRGNNYKLKYDFLPQPPRSMNYNPKVSDIYRIYQAAMEQGADTVYILATDWPDPEKVKLPWTDAETERYRRMMENYEKKKEALYRRAGWSEEKQQEYEAKVQKARAEGIAKARKWIKEENAKRKAKGKSLYVGTPYDCMREQKFYVPPQPAPPPIKLEKPEVVFKSYGKSGIINYYSKLFRDLYLDKKMKIPTLHIIIFRGKNDTWPAAQARAVRSFASAHNSGRVRILRGLEPVKD